MNDILHLPFPSEYLLFTFLSYCTSSNIKTHFLLSPIFFLGNPNLENTVLLKTGAGNCSTLQKFCYAGKEWELLLSFPWGAKVYISQNASYDEYRIFSNNYTNVQRKIFLNGQIFARTWTEATKLIFTHKNSCLLTQVLLNKKFEGLFLSKVFTFTWQNFTMKKLWSFSIILHIFKLLISTYKPA